MFALFLSLTTPLVASDRNQGLRLYTIEEPRFPIFPNPHIYSSQALAGRKKESNMGLLKNWDPWLDICTCDKELGNTVDCIEGTRTVHQLSTSICPRDRRIVVGLLCTLRIDRT